MKINTNIDLFSRYVKYITYRNNLRNKKLIYIFIKKVYQNYLISFEILLKTETTSSTFSNWNNWTDSEKSHEPQIFTGNICSYFTISLSEHLGLIQHLLFTLPSFLSRWSTRCNLFSESSISSKKNPTYHCLMIL